MTWRDRPSLASRVRWLNRLFRWGLDRWPGTSIGRPLLQQAIAEYELAGEDHRRALRQLFGECDDFSKNVALGDPVDTPERFRRQLLHFSLIYLADDPRDARLWLADLCREARAARVDIDPILRDVAEISSHSDESAWSAREELIAMTGGRDHAL